MASSCGICIQQKKTSPPSVWCPDCEVLLCETCNTQHQLFKWNKNHQIIPYDNYQKLPSFILNTNFNCADHDEKLTDFCRVHDQPICITCLRSSHRKCEDVPKIDDIVHNVKDSAIFEDVIKEMEAMCGTLRDIFENRNTNLKQIESSRREIKSHLEQKFDSIISHLNQLKENTISELDDVYTELTNDISNTLQVVQSKERNLREILNQKEDIKKFASNYQTFIGIKEIENIVHETDNNIQELFDNKKIDQYNITFDINETFEDIVCGIQSFGDIRVQKSPSAVSPHVIRAEEAQKEVQGGVRLHLQQTIELDRGHSPHGCCTLPSGLVVIADYGDYYNNDCKILIHISDGSLRSTIKFDKREGVWDVTPVDDHHVAVSHPNPGTISIIDVNSDQMVKKLKVGEEVYGLSCRGRDIVCCVWYEGLVRVNIDSEEVEMVVEDESVSDDSYVEVSNSLICYTCPNTHTVTVLDTQYNVLFTYQDEAVLGHPTGVTIDDHSNIYVTGCWSYNLVMISSDGKSCHQLLGRDDGLKYPTAVHYDSRTKKLVVVNLYGPAFIFSVG